MAKKHQVPLTLGHKAELGLVKVKEILHFCWRTYEALFTIEPQDVGWGTCSRCLTIIKSQHGSHNKTSLPFNRSPRRVNSPRITIGIRSGRGTTRIRLGLKRRTSCWALCSTATFSSGRVFLALHPLCSRGPAFSRSPGQSMTSMRLGLIATTRSWVGCLTSSCRNRRQRRTLRF